MIDSINIAASGLSGHQQGLRVISNNVSNMNTVGYKASRVDFSDLHTGNGNGEYASSGSDALGGSGLGAQTATLDISAGEFKSTGRDLDVALDGPGFFVLRSTSDKLYYTKSGEFEFDADGKLVLRGTDYSVMARNEGGTLQPILLNDLRVSPAKATSKVVLQGNLSSGGTTHTIEALKVYDSLGAERTLKLEFTNTGTTTAGSWSVTVSEGSTQLATGQFLFSNGVKDASSQPITVNLNVSGGAAVQLNIDLAPEATGFSSGTTSTLVLKNQDGYGMGQITQITFDDKGVLKLTYSNEQKKDGVTLAVAEIRSPELLNAVGDSMFEHTGPNEPLIRTPGAGIKVVAKTLELANVDLTSEFSSLILMQRGYQASSQVLTTANEMLQQLFEMSGR